MDKKTIEEAIEELSLNYQLSDKELYERFLFRTIRQEEAEQAALIESTCFQPKVKMYKKMGFRDEGFANSTWGGEQWHEMSCVVNI